MRLDQLKGRMGDAISIEWKSFLLRPEPKTQNQAEFVEYTRSWLRPADMEPATQFRVWATDNPQPTTSLPPHIATKALTLVSPESQLDYHDRLLTAYFTENRTISDWDVLLDLVADLGVDRSAVATAVETDGESLTEQVIDEHNEGISHGITAVPTTIIAGVMPIPGAQDVDTFESLITRLIEHQQTEVAG